MEINLICNGGVEIGIGHINRMITIYNEIKRRYNFPITFHIKGDFLKTINLEKVIPKYIPKNETLSSYLNNQIKC